MRHFVTRRHEYACFRFPSDGAVDDDDVSMESIGDDEYDSQDSDEQASEQSDHHEWDDEGDDHSPESNHSGSSQSVEMQSTTVKVTKRRTTHQVHDEFLSDDDESVNVQSETRAITLVGLLQRVFDLLSRCRQLVTDMRNIGVVNAYVLGEIGRRRGVILDMKVSICTPLGK